MHFGTVCPPSYGATARLPDLQPGCGQQPRPEYRKEVVGTPPTVVWSPKEWKQRRSLRPQWERLAQCWGALAPQLPSCYPGRSFRLPHPIAGQLEGKNQFVEAVCCEFWFPTLSLRSEMEHETGRGQWCERLLGAQGPSKLAQAQGGAAGARAEPRFSLSHP